MCVQVQARKPLPCPNPAFISASVDPLDRFATAFEVPAEVLDPRRLADAVAEGALTLRRREAIEAVLR